MNVSNCKAHVSFFGLFVFPERERKMPKTNEKIQGKRVIEVREITLKSPNEFRVTGEENQKMTGYAAVFDQQATVDTWWGDTYKESIKKGAFAKSINESDIFAVWNHNPDIVLGSSRNKTLVLSEDDYGLSIEIEPPNSSEGRSKLESVKRGDVKKMSFAFEVIKENIVKTKDANGKEIAERTLIEVKLWEVSPVVWPAYVGTTLGARSWLMDNGMDIETLAQAIRTRKLRGEFSPEEMETVRNIIENLRSLLPTETVIEPGEPLVTATDREPEQYHSLMADMDIMKSILITKGAIVS